MSPYATQLEQLIDLVEGKRRDDGAAVWAEADEPLGFELSQGLANWNSAHAELVGERVLAQRLTVREISAEDALAEGFDRHAGDRLASDGDRHARARWREAMRRINVRNSPKGHPSSTAERVFERIQYPHTWTLASGKGMP